MNEDARAIDRVPHLISLQARFPNIKEAEGYSAFTLTSEGFEAYSRSLVVYEQLLSPNASASSA